MVKHGDILLSVVIVVLSFRDVVETTEQVFEGDDFSIECDDNTFDATKGTRRLRWFHASEDLTAERKSLSTDNSGRYSSIILNGTDGPYRRRLYVKNATRSTDGGLYTCEVMLSSGLVVYSQTTSVYVISTRSMEDLGPVTARFIINKNGKDIILECYNNSNSNQGARNIENTSSKDLPLIRIDNWDGGSYFCNCPGCRENVTPKSVTAKRLPVITANRYGPNRTALQALNHSAILTCNVEAYPPPRIHWYKLPNNTVHLSSKAVKISFSNSHSIVMDSFKDGKIQLSLNVKSVSRDDYGTYLCHAHNTLGESELTVKLAQSKTPLDYNSKWIPGATSFFTVPTITTYSAGTVSRDYDGSKSIIFSFLMLLLNL